MITCDKCAYCSPTPGGSMYCALTDHFVPNLGCKDGEPINKPKTNADRIRGMNNRELAEVLLDFKCTTCDFDGFCKSKGKCKKEITEWLKSEDTE